MSKYKMEIKLNSDTLIGSGEGHGQIIDTDIVYDEIGIPYIPGKRIKGILLDSAEEINEMLGNIIEIKPIFGEVGITQGNMKIGNFFIDNYSEIKEWLKYLKTKSSLVNKNNILKYFTNLRYATAIDHQTGIAKEHSLRTERVINKGNQFTGKIDLDENYKEQLALICQNIRRMGTKRNRGYGEVEVSLLENSKKVDFDIKQIKSAREKEVKNESH